MEKLNCWEFFKCGRQPGGKNVKEFGVCPTGLTSEFDGINEGISAGRFCWRVSGTFCTGENQGSYIKKFQDCLNCAFLKKVNDEEGLNFILYPKKLKKSS